MGLRDNGGPTPTIALLPTSPAVNAGDNACGGALVAGVDQRGLARPQPMPGTCDIGAYEYYQAVVPTLASIDPPQVPVAADASDLTLTLTGTGFVGALTTATLGGVPLATTVTSPTSLTAIVPARLRGAAGQSAVTVTTAGPGGGTSNPLPFTVTNPTPTLTGLSPTVATAGSDNTGIILSGNSFAPGATVDFGGTTLTPDSIAPTSIAATVPAALLATARVVLVTVSNPGPGGGTSGSQSFTVGNPFPSTTDLAPGIATAGGTAFSLTVNGGGFVAGSAISFGGQGLDTTLVNATQVRATVPASAIRAAGIVPVAVTNPGPGGGTSSPALSFVINPADAAQLAVAGGSGQAAPVTTTFATRLAVTVRDQFGNLVGAGTTVTFAAPASGPSGSFAGGATTAAATTDAASVATAPVLTANGQAGSYGVIASAGGGAVPFALTNTPGPVAMLVVTTPAGATAGAAFPVTITVRDVVGNVATGYTGTVHFTSGDGQANLPADYHFVAADSGVHNFTATLRTAGNQTITATDTVSGGLTGVASVAVTAAIPASLVASGGALQSTRVGTAFATPLTATVRDTSGNPVAGIAVTFAAPVSGAAATFPGGGASVTIATGADGVATAPTLTANGAVGNYSVVASGAGGTATYALTNTPGPAAKLSVVAAAAAAAGMPLMVSVTVQDAWGNVVTGYTGTVHFSSTDTPATLPADYRFVAGDAGSHTLSVTFRTGGPQTVTVTDMANAAVTGSTTVQVTTPAAVSVAPTTLAFGDQQVGSAADSRQVTLINGGGSALAIDGVTLTGANPGDFAITINTCAGSIPAGGTCVAGVRFSPTAAGDRAATLQIADSAAGSPQAVGLSGTGTTLPASPAPQSTVTASAQDGGTVSPAGSTSYTTGSLATYTATPNSGQVFLGWTLDGQYVGYASPLSFTVNSNRTLVAQFAARPTFSDVPASDPDYQAITTLAALGIINPAGVNGTGQFQPGRAVARAEVAAFIARLFGWDKEFHANAFPDKCDPDGANCVDDELWNTVAALQDYGVVGGYTDAATCQAAGTTTPCYLSRDPVLRLQVVSIVARAFTKTPDLRPTGFWGRLPGVAGQYTNVPDAGSQRSDLATYRANAGAIPGQASDTTFPDPATSATRRFVIEVLWQAYAAQFGVDRVP